MTSARLGALAVALLASLPAPSQDFIPQGSIWNGHLLETDIVIASGWNYAQATGDFSKLRLALRPHCLSEQSGSLFMVEGYIRNEGRQMTRDQRYGLLEYCFSFHPDKAWELQVEMARERFNAWSPVEREIAYWEAVATGHNCVEGFYEFSRLDAVLLGAWARFDGFEGLVEVSGGEIDARHEAVGGLPYSQDLHWRLYLGSGTPDHPGVQRRFAQRLASLEPSFLFFLVENTGFAGQEILDHTRAVCLSRDDPALEDLARAVLKQRDLRLGNGGTVRDTPSWLAEFWDCTRYARFAVAKDADDAVRGDEIMGRVLDP